jgi:DNA-binding response OmpR family regulator
MAAHGTVLVVDGESTILDLIQDVLDDEGYTVRTAGDGASALALWRDEPPDLVLISRQLPDLSGETVLHTARRVFPSPVIRAPPRGISALRPPNPSGRIIND